MPKLKSIWRRQITLYIGKYPYQKWKDDSVRPHWNEIRSAREQQGIGKDNGRYRGKKKEHWDLESQLSQLIKKKAQMEASTVSIVTDGTAIEVSTLSRARNSFRGQSEREQKKNKWGVWQTTKCIIWVVEKLNKLVTTFHAFIIWEQPKRILSDIKPS